MAAQVTARIFTLRVSSDFRVSRHRCGQGESLIVVLSRIFVPGTGFASRARVDRAAEVDVLTRRSPSGATFIASQRSWAGQSRTARRAERREPRSGVLDGSEQPATREIASDSSRWSAARSRERHPRPGRVASSVASLHRASQVTRSHGQKAENLTTSMPREPDFQTANRHLVRRRSLGWRGGQANWNRSDRPFHHGISVGGSFALRMIGL